MTTRRRAIFPFCVGLLATLGFIVVVMMGVTALFPKETDQIGAVVCFVAIAAWIWYVYNTPCVHCGKPQGWPALAWGQGKGTEYAPNCPHCGTSIDALVAP